jgi:uncharacterized protein (TIGR02001 family)
MSDPTRPNNKPMKRQTMKRSISLLAAVFWGTAAALAAESSSYSVTVDFPYVSKYVFRGLAVARDSLQPSVEVNAGDFYCGVWANTPLVNPHDPTGAAKMELDVYGGYNLKLSDTLKADFGLTYYYYPQANKNLTRSHTVEGSLGLNWTVGGFTPSIYAYYDFTLKSWAYQGSVGYSLPLKKIGASLDLSATLGRVSPDGGGDYTYWSFGATVPFKLSETAKLNVGLTYTTNDLDGADDPGLWATVGVTVGF